MRTERLENLKVKLLEQPKNEQLITSIRELDLQLRKDRVRRLQFSQKGGLLLLGAIVVFLIGIKSAKAFKEKPTAITKDFWLKNNNIGNIGLDNFHKTQFLSGAIGDMVNVYLGLS